MQMIFIINEKRYHSFLTHFSKEKRRELHNEENDVHPHDGPAGTCTGGMRQLE
jgi:hypothetical protein